MQRANASDVFFDAFISYSTQDPTFVAALRRTLELNNRRVWQDVDNMELTAEWWSQIQQAITVSDNFLFVISPNSLASPICHLELEFARQLNKRIIPIRYQVADQEIATQAMHDRLNVDDYLQVLARDRDMAQLANENWLALKAIQQLSIPDENAILDHAPQLIEAFDKDLDYIRESNILLSRANEWNRSNKNVSFLLVGEALRAAEAWMQLGKQPPPTDLHRAYITESQTQEIKRNREVRRAQIAGVALIGIIIAAVIVLIITGNRLINAQNAQATAEARADEAIATVTQAAIIEDIVGSLASAILNDSQPEQQLEIVDNLIDTYPNQATAYQVRGLVYSEQRSFENALDNFSRAIELDETNARFYMNRANANRDLGNYAEAMIDYDYAIELSPESPNIYINRGLTQHSLQEYQAAIDDFTKAIELDDTIVLSYNNRGLSLYALGEFDAALADFDQAIALDPNDALFFNNRGLTKSALEDYEGAIADYNQAEAIDLQDVFIIRGVEDDLVYLGRGVAYFNAENYQAALSDYNQLIAFSPTEPTNYSFRALIHYFLNDYDSSLLDYEQFLLLGGELTESQQFIYELVGGQTGTRHNN